MKPKYLDENVPEQVSNEEEEQKSIQTVTIGKTSQQCQLVGSIAHGTSKVSQWEKLNHNEEHLQSPFVSPSSIVMDHEKFQNFVSSTKNSIALLDIDT